MYYVYLLQSVENERIYTGYTSDLKQRIQKHKSGNVHTTVRMGTVKLIYYEAFLDKVVKFRDTAAESLNNLN